MYNKLDTVLKLFKINLKKYKNIFETLLTKCKFWLILIPIGINFKLILYNSILVLNIINILNLNRFKSKQKIFHTILPPQNERFDAEKNC